MFFVMPLSARMESTSGAEFRFDLSSFAPDAMLSASKPADSAKNRARVDYKSDETLISNQGSFAKLVGNVAFHHNGVIITCDTAYRYSEKNMEGVGSVIINANDSVYIYGDRFTYDGESNIARVYSPIIKLVDGDAVLYTHNLSFNTLTGVGSYYDGGTMTYHDNLMESKRGDYYTDTRTIVLVGDVQMHNDDYDIKSDSVAFNVTTELVTFYRPAHIWNKNDEYLYAHRGTYDRVKDIYDIIDSAYIMTKERELWADSLKYFGAVEEVELRGDIQIYDSVQSLFTFGDYGYYWGPLKQVIMTKNPSSASVDTQNTQDTVFMRADTMFVIPQLSVDKGADTLGTEDINNALIENGAVDTIVENNVAEDNVSDMSDMSETPESPEIIESSEIIETSETAETSEVPGGVTDDVMTDTIVADGSEADSSVTKEVIADTIDKKAVTDTVDGNALSSLSKIDSLLAVTDWDNLTKKEIKTINKARKRLEREAKREAKQKERMSAIEALRDVKRDSIAAADSLKKESVAADTVVRRKRNASRKADSSDYVLRGYHNVRIYRADMQSVCDSIVAITLDSTMFMYGKPIVWNENNQITASYIKMYSANEQLDRAELYDFPIIGQRLESDRNRYNQIRGKYMEAYFKNNELDIVYIDGNAETIFYKEDDGEPTSMFYIMSANMEIYFDSSQVSRLKWISDITHSIYPIDKIPPTQKLALTGFKWITKTRPQNRFDVCDRVIIPSKREQVKKITLPLFRITAKINQERFDMTKAGTWVDRTELSPVDLSDFLGVEPVSEDNRITRKLSEAEKEERRLDSLRRDSIRKATFSRDSIRSDSVVRASFRRDSLRKSVGNDSAGKTKSDTTVGAVGTKPSGVKNDAPKR